MGKWKSMDHSTKGKIITGVEHTSITINTAKSIVKSFIGGIVFSLSGGLGNSVREDGAGRAHCCQTHQWDRSEPQLLVLGSGLWPHLYTDTHGPFPLQGWITLSCTKSEASFLFHYTQSWPEASWDTSFLALLFSRVKVCWSLPSTGLWWRTNALWLDNKQPTTESSGHLLIRIELLYSTVWWVVCLL